MRSLLAVALASILLLTSFGSALACTCGFTTAEEQLQASDRVFSGTVLGVESLDGVHGQVRRAVVRVREIWKGDGESRIVVDTTPNASCTLTLELGQNYMIYADASDEEGVYWTHECKRTRLRNQADADIVKLGEPTFIVSGETPSWGAIKARFGAADS